MASGSDRSSIDPYDSSSNHEEYLAPNNVAETTPRRSDRAAPSLSATGLDLNSPPEAPKNRGQINPNLEDYNSDPMWISSAFWIPDITDWWREMDEMHSKHADLSNVARDIFCLIPHGVRVESSVFLRRDVICLRQSKSTCETHRKIVIVRQFAPANKRNLAGGDPEVDSTHTENDSKLKTDVEERKLPKMSRCTSIWGCGRAAKTSVLPRMNLALEPSR